LASSAAISASVSRISNRRCSLPPADWSRRPALLRVHCSHDEAPQQSRAATGAVRRSIEALGDFIVETEGEDGHASKAIVIHPRRHAYPALTFTQLI
jgi:hypothetical protein